MLERGGSLITQVISNTQQNTIEPIIKTYIKKNANVFTDEWHAYKDLNKQFDHQIVNHSAKQYVNEKAHTNSIENFWSHLKRGIYGTYVYACDEALRNYLVKYIPMAKTNRD